MDRDDATLAAPRLGAQIFGDKMVGSDFEAGLANLKAVAEKP